MMNFELGWMMRLHLHVFGLGDACDHIKALDSTCSNIKRQSVLKACCANILYVCWGEYCYYSSK